MLLFNDINSIQDCFGSIWLNLDKLRLLCDRRGIPRHLHGYFSYLNSIRPPFFHLLLVWISAKQLVSRPRWTGLFSGTEPPEEADPAEANRLRIRSTSRPGSTPARPNKTNLPLRLMLSQPKTHTSNGIYSILFSTHFTWVKNDISSQLCTKVAEDNENVCRRINT